MTFSVLLVKDDQRRVVGTLWAADEATARAAAPVLCADVTDLSVCRTEDREIPLRLEQVPPMQFC